MKTFVYISLIIILGSFIFNLVSMDYESGILSEENRPYIIGLGAGVCGLVLCAIFLKYYRLKANLENRSKQE